MVSECSGRKITLTMRTKLKIFARRHILGLRNTQAVARDKRIHVGTLVDRILERILTNSSTLLWKKAGNWRNLFELLYISILPCEITIKNGKTAKQHLH